MSPVDNQPKLRGGFTMVELMLSMSFVSMLLIVIMMTIIQITNMYNKGLSMREVNQVGREISDDLSRTIASSAPFDVSGDESKLTNRYIIRDGTGGRLCTGKSTYIWNYGESTSPNKYQNGDPVRIVKLPDASGQYCLLPGKDVPNSSDVVDLLKSGDRNLVIHNFSVSQASEANDVSTGQALYAIKFTIGTNDQDLLTSDKANCKPPAESGRGNDSYCAVNKFEVIARAGNRAEPND